MVSVGTSIVPPEPRPPPADTPGPSTAVTTPQVTGSIHDFAASLLTALSDLVAQGKVRYIGHSNFSGWQLAEAASVARELRTSAFISAQNHWSWLERATEAEVVPAAAHYGLGVLPYFPLANGLLTGKVRRGQAPPAGSRLAGRPEYITDAKLDQVEALSAWAERRGITILDVAIGGLAAQPGCSSVIAGATSPEQVKANAEASDWVPSADDLAELNRIVPGPPGPA